MINHNVSGGAGSGLTSTISDRLVAENRKLEIMYNTFLPSFNAHDNLIVAPYNALEGLYSCLSHSSLTNIYTN